MGKMEVDEVKNKMDASHGWGCRKISEVSPEISKSLPGNLREFSGNRGGL